MYFTSACLVPWLIGRGLVDANAIVRGDLQIAEFERNNRCFQVMSRDRPSWFVKQLRELTEFNIEGLRREAAVYRLAAREPRFDSIRHLMPAFATFDPQRHAVVVESLDDAENVHQFHNRVESYPIEVGRQLGERLSVFHSPLGRDFAAAMNDDLFPGRPPWILSFHRDQGDGRLSPGNQRLLELILNDGDLADILDELALRWQLDGLMHRDLKWNNLLLVPDVFGTFTLTIIDWELADTGDWCWDAGMALQNWWSFEALAAPDDAPVEAEAFLEYTSNLEATRPAVQAFWSSWISNVDLAERRELSFVRKCVQYAAARLLQTTYELLHHTPEMNDRGLRLFRLSTHLLKNPDVAVRSLAD